MSKSLRKVLSIFLSLALLLSSLVVGSIMSAAASVEDDVVAAANAYVSEKKNNVTKDGLLAAVQAVAPGATLADDDFYILHAIPGVKDNDTTSGYPLNIEGSDGAVTAIFDVDGTIVGISIPIAHETEIIDISEVAIAGESEGFTYDRLTKNVASYSGNANKIVVPVDYTATIGGANGTCEFPGVEVVILANQVVLPEYALANETDLIAVQLADGAAPDGTGYPRRHWFSGAGQFKDCPNLKYVHLPEYCNVGTDMFIVPNIGFLRCSSLENVNMPIYAGGYQPRVHLRAFEGTAVREFQFSLNLHTPGSTLTAVPEDSMASPAFTEGTRNVNFYATNMTFERAASLITAAMNEQFNAGVEGDEALAAAKAAALSVPCVDGADVINALNLSYSGGVLSISNSAVTVKATIAPPSAEDLVVSAATAYVNEKKNDVSKEGLLAAVQAVAPTATLADDDFYIYHAAPGVKDDDTTSGHPLNIAGHDGAVAAIFDVDGVIVAVAVPITYEVEVINISEVAIVGESEGFTYDRLTKNVTSYTGTADKIVVPADYNGTIGGANGETDFEGVEVVVIENLVALPAYALANETSVVAVQMANGTTPDGTGFARVKWRAEGSAGQFKDCPNLKYVHLPEYMNVYDYDYNTISESCFLRTPSLVNVNIPVYPGGYVPRVGARAFEGSGIRELQFSLNPHTPGNTLTVIDPSVIASPAFTEGTRNVNFYATPMTFERAAALITAAMNEQLAAGVDATAALAAAKEAALKVSCVDGADVINALTLAFNNGVLSVGNGAVDIKAKLADSGSADVGGGDEPGGNEPGNVEVNKDDLTKKIIAAAQAYVNEKKNDVTKDGLLAAVQAVEAGATLADADFYIQHAIPGVTDNDTTSGYVLNIPGKDGAVAAVFKVNGKSVGVSISFAHEKEVIDIVGVAIVGQSEGFTYSNGDVTGYNGTANKVVVPADYAGSIATAKQVRDMPGVEVIIMANQGILPEWALSGESDLIAFQMADGTTPDGTGYPRRHWFTGKGQFLECDKLKYVHLPEYTNISENQLMFPAMCFRSCPKLENLNIPVYAGGYAPSVGDQAFMSTGLRELLFGNNTHTPNNIVTSLNDTVLTTPSFTEGTRNVNFYTTSMTFTRAAALVQSALADLNGMYDQDAIIEAAKAAITGSSNAAAMANSIRFTWYAWDVTDYRITGELAMTLNGATIFVSVGTSRTLSGLETGYVMTPAFDPSVLEYTVTVPNDITKIDVDAIAVPGAVVGTISGNTNLALGENTITIPVTAINNGKTVNYTIKVTRYETNMTLEQAVAKVGEAFNNGNWKNYTTAEMVLEKLQAAVRLDGYSVSVEEYYIANSIGGATMGNQILVEGHNGYIACAFKVSKGNESRTTSQMYTIEPVMTNYNFDEEDISTPDEFELVNDGKVLDYYTGDAKVIIVPDTVEEIVEGWYDGSDANDVIVLILPDSVTTLPYNLCYAMGNLEVCRLSDSITEVMGFAFQDCFSLRYVHLPKNAEKIGGSAFAQCYSLETIYLPESMKRIEANAFYTGGLRYITLGKNVEFVGDYAFAFPQRQPGGSASKMNSDQITRITNLMATFRMYDREITILNKDLQIAARAAFGSDQTNGSGSRCVIRATADTTVFQSEQGRYPYCTIFHLDMDMDAAEAATRAQMMADHLDITVEDDADDVIAQIANGYVSSKIKALTWAEELTFAEDGSATGVLTVADDIATFNVVIDTSKEPVDDNTGNEPGDNNGGNTGNEPGDNNGGNTDNEPGDNNGGNTGNEPGDNNGGNTGNEPGDSDNNNNDDNKSPATGDVMPVGAIMLLLVSAVAIAWFTTKKRTFN